MLDFGFYNMDCMEGMKEFPDKYFDLAIVDPPYGDGGGTWKRQDKSRFGGTFDRYKHDSQGGSGNGKTRAGSAVCSTGIARTGFHGKVYSHGRNMGEQVRQKNHFVGHSPGTRLF